MIENLKEKQKKRFIQGAFINLPIGFAIAMLVLLGSAKLYEIQVTFGEVVFILSGLTLTISAIVYRLYRKLKKESETE